MRAIVPFLLVCAVTQGCSCGPDTAVPITIRVKNSSASPLFVDQSDQRLGVEIQRKVGSDWISFVEQPACECLSCDLVCNGVCDCPQAPQRLIKIAPNTASERTWGGVVQVDGNGSCGLVGGPACLRAENAPVDETFRAKLCFALSVPQAPSNVDAGTPFSGKLPDTGVLCQTKEFSLRDEVVELSPPKGAACTQHSECTGADELCLGGECTTACPANEVPQLGSGWAVALEVEPGTLFSVDQSDPAVARYSASGEVASVTYNNGTMGLRLRKLITGTSSYDNGAVYVTTPAEYQVAFTAGEQIAVLVLDRSTANNPSQRGVVIRDAAGHLLLAADVGQGEPVLSATELTPFSVELESGEILGCAATDCGKQLQQKTVFNGGAQPVAVNPGQALPVVAGDQAFKVLNAANFRYATTACPLKRLIPYAILNTRQGTAP